jgi:hypothetical protein
MTGADVSLIAKLSQQGKNRARTKLVPHIKDSNNPSAGVHGLANLEESLLPDAMTL